jgi:hypothetical protein
MSSETSALLPTIATPVEPNTIELREYSWNNPGPMFKNSKRVVVSILLLSGTIALLNRFGILKPGPYLFVDVSVVVCLRTIVWPQLSCFLVAILPGVGDQYFGGLIDRCMLPVCEV